MGQVCRAKDSGSGSVRLRKAAKHLSRPGPPGSWARSQMRWRAGMKNINWVIRPIWADLERSETLIITTAAAAVALYGVFGEHLVGWLLAAVIKFFGFTLAEENRLKIGNFIDAIVVPILI